MKTLYESVLDDEDTLMKNADDNVMIATFMDTYKIINPLNHYYAGSAKDGHDRFGRQLRKGDVVCYTTEKTEDVRKFKVGYNHCAYYGIVTEVSPLTIALTLDNKWGSNDQKLVKVQVSAKETNKIVFICHAEDVKKYFG